MEKNIKALQRTRKWYHEIKSPFSRPYQTQHPHPSIRKPEFFTLFLFKRKENEENIKQANLRSFLPRSHLYLRLLSPSSSNQAASRTFLRPLFASHIHSKPPLFSLVHGTVLALRGCGSNGVVGVLVSARLHTLAVDARSAVVGARGFLARVVDVDDVKGVDVARDVTEEGQANVNEDICAAAGDEDDADGGNC